MGTIVDRTGERFGRLVVIEFVGKKPPPGSGAIWLCKCDCGNLVEATNSGLVAKNKTSCGCLYLETHSTHGMTNSPEFISWSSMKARCNNENGAAWRNYGGRGISICQRWESFEAFYEDMGPRPSLKHTLDRIDNDGDYEPSNCKWSTPKEQHNNTRQNVQITYKGKTMTVIQWARKLKINPGTLYDRKRRGWSDERTITEPHK